MPLGYFQNGQFIHGNLYFRDNETGEFEKVCEITDVDEVQADNIIIEESPSMYAIQSLHDDCPLKKESEE